MSTTLINGTLLMNGDLVCSGDVVINGLVVPIPDRSLMRAYRNPDTGAQVYSVGKGRTISSTSGNITINGVVNGDAQGFGWGEGPGCNAAMQDSSGNTLIAYGATHAGLGAYLGGGPGIPAPKVPYGSPDSPVSLGSGSGFYHDMTTVWGVNSDGTPGFYPVYPFGVGSSGGGAVKIEALSGVVLIDGTVSMDGFGGDASVGGGAGGSIWVHGFSVYGTGLLSADGGTSGALHIGGGGGGYVSVWHEGNDYFTGTMTVEGGNGAGSGKASRTLHEPDLIEKFTGRILNTKWWDGSCAVDNHLMVGTDSTVDSTVSAIFTLTGRSFGVEADYVPEGLEGDYFTGYMKLEVDPYHWVAMQRRNGQVWGMYMEDGVGSAFATNYPNYPATFRILKNDSTFSFQYWDSTSDAPVTLLRESIPTMAEAVFSVRFGVGQFPGGADVRVEHWKLNASNIANMRVYLDGLPISHVAMDIPTGTSQYQGSDFYMTGNELRWDPAGLTFPGGTFHTEFFVLSPADIINKYVTLTVTPDRPDNVAVSLVYGTTQEFGVDFGVSVDKIIWAGFGLDGWLSAGDSIRVDYYSSPFYHIVPLVDLLEEGDGVRAIYQMVSGAPESVQIGWDGFRIYDGAVYGSETTEPVLYVDPVSGSDSSSGRQLDPLQNLFVATAWSKQGGTVVLYDGTHGPVDVSRKDLTIMGAEGSRALVTSLYSQDTTGAGWERNALSFDRCRGMADNLIIRDGTAGVRITRSPDFEVRRCDMSNLSTGIEMVDCDPILSWNTVTDVTTAFSFDRCLSGTVVSNVVSGSGVYAEDSTDIVVVGNTFNGGTYGVLSVRSSVVASSNNMTDMWLVGVGITDSTVKSYGNNFYGSFAWYSGIPADTSGDYTSDPLYALPLIGNYHLDASSPNIGIGSSVFDPLMSDRDGVSRTARVDVGAYQYVDQSHVGDWFVAGIGDDWLNNGDQLHPFRTLDMAMLHPWSAADATVRIDGGHYDSYFLSLLDQPIGDATRPVELTIFTLGVDHFVTYREIIAQDVTDGRVALPGFVETAQDASNVALNVVGGPAQLYGRDYVVQYGQLVWKGYDLEPLLAVGDILRIIYFGRLQAKALNTMILRGHHGNIDFSHAIWMSPNGSDSSTMGGDGTNSGGDGSRTRPFRTAARALRDSSVGDYVVSMAGEYPFFRSGMASRVLAPATDRTAVDLGRVFVEDGFSPNDFRPFGSILYDSIPWDFTSAGRSWARSNAGWLSLSFDGSNEPWAVSSFDMSGNWEVSASLRNAVDPLWFSVTAPDSTVALRYDGTEWRSYAHTGGRDFTCWGIADVPAGDRDKFVVDYLPLTSSDIMSKSIPLGFIPEGGDCSAMAVNVVGGVAQEYGEDFTVSDSIVSWDGFALDGDLEPGDVLRVVYKDRRISGPMGARLSLKDGILRAEVNDGVWRTTMRRNLVETVPGIWRAAFYMADPDASHSHTCVNGRGFVTGFLAVADAMTGPFDPSPYAIRTERTPLVFFNRPDQAVAADISSWADGTRTVFRVPAPPVVRGDNSMDVADGTNWLAASVDGTAAMITTMNGASGWFALSSAPPEDSTVIVNYYTLGRY